MGRTLRRLLVGLHLVASVGWLAQAVPLLALLTVSAADEPGGAGELAAAAAVHLDVNLLVQSANVAAGTGLLSTASRWGPARIRWLASTAALPVVQVVVGTVVLPDALRATARAAATGVEGPVAVAAAATALMVGALAVQTWLSAAGPGARPARPEPGPDGPGPVTRCAVRRMEDVPPKTAGPRRSSNRSAYEGSATAGDPRRRTRSP